MNKLKSIAVALLCFILVGCGTLAPDGFYKGSKVLYTSDQVFETTHDILDAFLLWEHTHRMSLFQLAPEIKKAADKIRTDAPGWFGKYEDARTQYLLFPSAEGKSNLMKAINELEKLAVAAQSITTKYRN